MKNILNRLLGLDNSFILYFILSIATSFLSYFFQVYLGGRLSLIDYGTFNSINSLCSNLLCFYTPLSVFLCRELAEANGNMSKIRPVLSSIRNFTGMVSVFVVLIIGGLFLGGFGSNMTFVKSEGIIIVIVIIISGGIYSVANGALQGANRLEIYGAVGFVAVAIKYIFTLLKMHLETNVQAPLIAMIISNIAIILFIILYLNKSSENDENQALYKREVKYSDLVKLYGITFVANLLISPFINGGEIVLMSSAYDGESVGMYSLAITIVKASVYIISIFTAALLPRFAAIPSNTKRLYRKYILALIISFTIGVAWVLFIRFIGIRIIPIVFGEGYREALHNIKYMAAWIINLGVIMVVNTFYLATNRLKKYILVLMVSILVLVFSVKIIHINFWVFPVELGVVSGFIILWAIIDAIKKMNECVECE